MLHIPLRRLLVSLIPLIAAVAAIALPPGEARADLGPKPTVEFTFTQNFSGRAVTITSGTLLQCEQPDCADAHPLPGNLGPQGFRCKALTCSGLAYGFSDYGRLEITFSDGKTRQSNIFAITAFHSFYDVAIQESSLVVTEQLEPANLSLLVMCLGCCCGLLLGIAVTAGLAVFFAWRGAAA